MKKASMCALLFALMLIPFFAGSFQLSAASALKNIGTLVPTTPVFGALIPGGGAPMPTCFPGKNCGDNSDQQQTIAGDGAPMPTCFPGKNCGDNSDQQQTVALLQVGHRMRLS